MGYKPEVIKEYFINYKKVKFDLLINIKDGTTKYLKSTASDLKVNLIDTGKTSMTGGRILRLKEYLNMSLYAYLW